MKGIHLLFRLQWKVYFVDKQYEHLSMPSLFSAVVVNSALSEQLLSEEVDSSFFVIPCQIHFTFVAAFYNRPLKSFV